MQQGIINQNQAGVQQGQAPILPGMHGFPYNGAAGGQGLASQQPQQYLQYQQYQQYYGQIADPNAAAYGSYPGAPPAASAQFPAAGYAGFTGAAPYFQMAQQSHLGGSNPYSKAASSTAPSPNLFVFHLPTEWDDNKLKSTFEPYGNIVSAKVFFDKASNLSKGFGFVTYDSQQAAGSAIQALNGTQYGGKRLKVDYKKPGSGRPY